MLDDPVAHRRPVALLASAVLLLALAACGGDGEAEADEASPAAVDPVAAAQAVVEEKQAELAEAQTAEADATAELCTASETYVSAIDRYGDVLDDTAPTVGDVTTAGSDLAGPAEEVQATAGAVQETREAVTAAQQELADAEADLVAAQAEADGASPPPEPSEAPSPSPTETPLSVTRVQEAQADLVAAQEGITERTPLVEAAEQFNAAAVALEMAWLRLLGDSGCLTDDEQAAAAEAVSAYTATLQQALTDAGYYDAGVDGIYGPRTVEAVEDLQAANDLPQTGTFDKATEEALRRELEAQADAAAQEETASTAALQQTLALIGYWDGPVDGQWSDELTAAVERLQTDLGVPVTGAVDAVTVAAVQKAVVEAAAPPSEEPAPTTTVTTTTTVTPEPTASG
jgi:peptidoglycan hydrolase-like protein with peptidoglycan-binding domain